MSVILNATSAVMSVTAFTFYLIGVVGYSLREEVVKNVNWFHAFQRNGLHVNVGLRALYFSDATTSTQQAIYSKCSASFCDRCEKYGESAFALLVVALVLSFIATLLSVSGIFAPSSQTSGANIAMSLTSVIFGVIGFGLFTHNCYPRIENLVDYDFDYGPGAILTLIAFMLTFLVAVIQVVATTLSPAPEAAAAAPVKSEAVSTNEL